MLSMRIYNSILNQIFCHNLKVDDRVPSIQTLCEQYSVAYNTARAAVQRLYEDGFISKEERKPSRVVFDVNDLSMQRHFLQNISERKEQVLDAYLARYLVLPDFMPYCAKRLTQEELDFFDVEFTDGVSHSLQCVGMMRELTRKLISKLENSILDLLLDATDLSMTLPFSLFSVETERMTLLCSRVSPLYRTICQFIRLGRYSELPALFRELYHASGHYIGEILENFSQEKNLHNGPTMRQELSPIRKPIYLTIAYDILDQAVSGKIKRGSFLPAESEICESYGVSKRPVKAALALLNEMGVAETINGKGTLILYDPDLFFDPHKIQSSLLPHLDGIFESLLVLAGAMEGIASYAATRLDLPALFSRSDLDGESGRYLFPPIMMANKIAEGLQSQILIQITNIIKQNWVWGVFLLDPGMLEATISNLSESYFQAMEVLDDPRQFAAKVQKICFEMYQQSLMACQRLELPVRGKYYENFKK